jgi:hypothetical protein
MKERSYCMGAIIGIVLFGIPAVIIAGVKGFKPLRWLLAFGLIGLIVVAALPSAKDKDVTDEVQKLRAAKANRIGAGMCALCLIASAIIALFILTMASA